MPIYEYKCRKCGSHFEKRRSVSDAPLIECEKCGGELEKQWSLSGFSFKGEGWYVTDYAGKKAGKSETGDGEKSSGIESTTSTDSASKPTTDTKPAKSENVAKKD
jgi:putative FmdB family regulatory protein